VSCDVIARPSAVGLAARRAQIERERLALLAQMEREELAPDPSPLPRGHVITAHTVSRLARSPRPQ